MSTYPEDRNRPLSTRMTFASEYDDDRRMAESREEVRAILAPYKAQQAKLDAQNAQKVAAVKPAEGSPASSDQTRFPVYTSDAFGEFGDVEYALDGVFPARALAVVYGAPQAGKSALVLDAVRAMVTGSTWLGRDTLKCNVWVISLEGQAGLRLRVKAMEKYHEMSLPKTAGFVFDDLNLMKQEDVDGLKARIQKHPGVQVIVIDTLACAMAGGDENSSKDMGKVLSAAKEIQRAIDGLVILVHHTGKDASRGMRGHSSLLGAVDVAIEVKRHENHRSWRLAKARDAEDGVTGAFVLEKVELEPDGKGRPRSSIVVVHTEMPADAAATIREPAYKHQRTALVALKLQLIGMEAMEDGGPATIPFDQAVDLVKDSIDVTPKHQKLRAQEAIRGLVKGGYLLEQDGVISLPADPEGGG